MIRKKLLFLAILYLPGTAIHELSHFFVAKLLGVRTGKISLTPKFGENSLQLGSVQIENTDFVRRFLIGIAPLVVGLTILISVFFTVIYVSLPWWGYIALGYLGLSVLNTMSLSKSDLQGAWKILLILALALAFVIKLH